MIVLLSYFMSLSINSFAVNSSTGRLEQDSISNDSVLIAYSDLRKVNAKLVELEYERSINEHLRSVISNDSIAIYGLRTRIARINADYQRDIKSIKRQRNTAGGIGITAIILLIISIL